MTKKFAKLYETERGQIVVMRETGDNGPEIGVYFDAGVPGLAVTRIAVSGFGDDDDIANDRADIAFEKIEEEGAKKVAFNAMDQVRAIFNEAGQ